MDEHQIVSIWDVFKDFIPEKQRENAAARFIDYLLDHDNDSDDLPSLIGYDSHLDTAIKAITSDEDQYEEEDEDNYYDDEE